MKRIDGQPVINAAMTVRINVTRQDIEAGAPMNPNACAIAVAALRQIKGATAARVHLSCVYVNVKGQWCRWHVPEYATREIVAYDRGGRFVPGEIDLTPVSTKALQRHAAGVRSPGVRSKPKTKQRPRHYTEDVRDSAHANEPRGR